MARNDDNLARIKRGDISKDVSNQRSAADLVQHFGAIALHACAKAGCKNDYCKWLSHKTTSVSLRSFEVAVEDWRGRHYKGRGLPCSIARDRSARSVLQKREEEKRAAHQ